MSSTESKTSSSTSGSTLTLQVKTLKGANFAITVPTNYTVAELQAQIARERDVPVDQQRIIYKGKVLKSDQTLASYGLEDGDNLHLIVRTPQQQQAAQQAIAAEQASMSDVHAPGGAQPGTNPSPQIQIFPAGENGMMIGSVDIQDHGAGIPDLNQIVNQVLNQMGVPGLGQSGTNANAPTITFSTSPTIALGPVFGEPMGNGMIGPVGGMMSMGMGMPMMSATVSTSASSSSSSSSSSTSTSTSSSSTSGTTSLPPSTSIPGFGGISHGGSASLNDLRLGMNQVAELITPSTSTTLTSIGRGINDIPITTQTSTDVVTVFEQLHTLLSNITPRVADVVMSLRRQETLTGAARQQVTQQANDVGMALRRLSPMLHHVGRYGSGLNLGTDPSHVTVVQAQPQVSVHVTSQPVITAVTTSQPFTTHTSTPFAFPTTATTSQMFGYSAPTTATTAATASTTSATSTSTSSTDTTTSQSTANAQQAPVNMQQIMAQVGPMVGPIVSQLFSGAAAAANAATNNNTNGAPTANPLAAIMQAVGPAVQQVASSIQQGGSAGGNPLMSMIQNVMGSLAHANQPATTSAGVTATSTTSATASTPTTATATATPTVTPAFTGSVTGSTSAPSNAPASSSASTSTSTSSSSSSSTSSSTASPIDATSFAQLMSGMMGVLGQQAQAQAQQGATSGTSTSTSTAPATSSSAATSSSTSTAPVAIPVAAPIATPITSQPAPNPFANLLSGMGSGGMSGIMGMMSQIMGNAQGGRTIGDIMASMGAGQQMDEDHDDDDDMEDEPRRRSPMEAIINRVITGLSMPDMMAMVSGNWAPLERQHGTLRDILLHDMMDDTDTPHARDSVAITLAMGFVNTLLNEQVLASVRDKMIPEKDLHAASYPVVRQRCRELINIVIDTPISTSTTQGTPFATQVQSWSYLLVGSWMNVLAEGFTDGITSVDTVIKNAVQLKLSSISPEIGFMLPMVSGMLSSFVLRAHQQYRANLISNDDGTGAQGWIQHVPENEQKHWITTIAMDEKIQAEQKEAAIKEAQQLGITTARIQHPFSYSYSSGSAGAAKRRRLGGSTLREGEVQDEKESSNSSSSSSTTSSTSALYSPADLEGADLGAGLSRALKSAIDTVNQQMIKEEQKSGRLNAEDVDARQKDNEKKAQEVIADLPSSNIQQLYRSQLIQDIRKRVRTDPDYNPAKFPKTSEHIDKA